MAAELVLPNSPREILLLKEAIGTVLKDDGFKVPSEDAASALCTAEKLLRQPRMENSTFLSFSKYLVTRLQSCFGRPTLMQRTRTSRMWGLFHELRTSDVFVSKWKTFLQESLGSEHIPRPAFYQYVTQKTFKLLIKQEFKISTTSEAYSLCEISSDDQSALRYVAGFVCRKVREKLESSSTNERHKNDMILTLLEFRGSGIHSQHESEDWISSLDRGGLWHVTDDVFTFFCYMEEVIRHYFRRSNTKGSDLTEVTKSVVTNEEVLFQWCLLSLELDHKVGEQLRDMIVKLYITVRGFAFASSCMELYKKWKKETIQKKKGIRSRVLNK